MSICLFVCVFIYVFISLMLCADIVQVREVEREYFTETISTSAELQTVRSSASSASLSSWKQLESGEYSGFMSPKKQPDLSAS